MSEMPERIWAFVKMHNIVGFLSYTGSWLDKPATDQDCTEYIRADLVPDAGKMVEAVARLCAVIRSHSMLEDYFESLKGPSEALEAVESLLPKHKEKNNENN